MRNMLRAWRANRSPDMTLEQPTWDGIGSERDETSGFSDMAHCVDRQQVTEHEVNDASEAVQPGDIDPDVAQEQPAFEVARDDPALSRADHHDQVLAAQAEGRWVDLVEHAREMTALDAGDIQAALLVAEGSRELGDLDGAEAALMPFRDQLHRSAELAFSHALNAEKASDFEAAATRWQAARASFPQLPYAWAAEATTQSILGHLVEADAILNEAVGLGLRTIEILAARVQVAVTGKDWFEAERRWQVLAGTFPDASYTRMTEEPVRRAIDVGLSQFDAAAFKRSAADAEADQHWQAALFFWRAGRQRFPDRPDFATGVGRVLRRAGHFDEADAAFAADYDTHAGDTEFRANYAEVAASRKDWQEAARRWEGILARFPDVAAFWSMAATAYRETGRLAEAEELLARAAAEDPENADLSVQIALTAEKASDWPRAIHHWDRASRLRPGDLVIKDARGNAIWEQQIARLEKGEAVETPDATAGAVPSTQAEADSLRALALSFEGLGDQCEFGIVQRRLGADPIGLFRFAAISADNLAALLDEEFERLGDPDFTELGFTEGGEYLVRDTRHLYHMHSFVQKDTVDPDLFLSQQVRRLGYLKRKLIEDLQAAEKIFVFKSSLARISDTALCRLQSSIARYGDGMILGLRRAEENHSAGSLEILTPRVLVGYLETEYRGEQMPIDFASWRRVLIAAVRYRDAALKETRGAAELVQG